MANNRRTKRINKRLIYVREISMELAISGGKPVRKDYLPYGQQWIDDYDIDKVSEVLKGSYLTTGPNIEIFEQKIAEYVGAKYAVTFSNGTAALHGAAFAAGIGEGDEVITSAMTFAASANCVLYQKGKPIFADIDRNTYNIDPNSIEKLITKKTKAIIPVDYTGQPADLDKISEIARKYNLVVIEDAAHSLGATYKGRKIGSISDMTMFSFHPVKHITTGEGGVITTNNEDYYNKLIQFRSHGITKDVSKFVNENQGPWYHEMQFLGYNYRMTDIQAALGIGQFTRLDYFINKRQEYAQIYNEAFINIPEITIPYQDEAGISSWHLYVIKLNLDMLKAGRKAIYEAFLAENIGVNVHYIPVYYHPYYKDLGYEKGLCPNAEELYEVIITLPLFPKMTEHDANDVIKAVEKIINYYKK